MINHFTNSKPAAPLPILVHSHLRWDFVWQRPQQILSRLAKNHPVLFVEEPLFDAEPEGDYLQITEPYSHVIRAVPHLPRALCDQYDNAARAVSALLVQTLNGPLGEHFQRPVQWFYTPMPAPIMLGHFNERGVVYDCMDELAQFRHAPPDIGKREKRLLAAADVVFTGGHKLYTSKSRYHDNVHFFGCGVDTKHFGKARLEETVIPADVRELPRPVMGYFGVIDERLDYGLIAALAAAQSKGSVVMVGPVVKVDPAELPRAANIHWLGQRAYEDLPAYVKSFDVCLMPFALNEATEYINPTKTLEYMAAGKPIVSTAVSDVVHNFTPIVKVAYNPAEYIAAVTQAITAPNQELLAAGVKRAALASWNSTVATMRQLILESLAQREKSVGAAKRPKTLVATEYPVESSTSAGM